MLLEPHERLLQELDSIDGLSVRFDGAGKTATYKAWITGTKANVLWTYENGSLYVRWSNLRNLGGEHLAETYRQLWKELAPIDQPNGDPKPDGAMLYGGLVKVAPETIKAKLTNFMRHLKNTAS